MKRTVRRLTYLTWVITVAVFGALLWLSFQEPRGQTRRLPDGATAELAAVTFGREHRYIAGHLWQRLREQALPAASAPTDGQRSTPVEQPVLWLRWNEAQRAPNAPLNWTQVGVTIDDHGCILLNGQTPGVWSARSLITFADSRSPAPGYQDVSPVTLDVYPRRSGHFQFGILNSETYQTYQSAPLAAYDVTVPPGGPFPEWRASKPPANARSGDLEVVLESLRHGLGGLSSATFRYREHGRPTTNWQPDSITVFDATGNSLTCGGEATPDGATRFSGLCRREPAWKLRVRFVRRRPAEAPARFLWRFPAVTAPARDHQLQLPVRAPSGPIALLEARVLGGGRITHADGGVSTYGRPGLVVKVGKFDPRFSLAVTRATNELGHDLPLPQGRYFGLGPDQAEAQLVFPYPPGTKQLHLTLGLYETHTVEFLVKPQ